MDKPKALIIGAKGLLGREVVEQAEKYTDWEIVTSDLTDEGGIDITNEASVAEYYKKHKPNIVINCAAITDVNRCETDSGYFDLAKKVNGYGPGLLAKHAVENDALLIHISSDHVFGENKQPGYKEDYDNYKPLNKYAQSKVLGEEEVRKYMDKEGNKLYIVRPSWLFGKGATNFIAKVIELSEKFDTLKMVTDEVSSPTYIKDLAQRLIYIIEEQPEPGIYHAAGNGAASRYDFAKKILEVLGKDTKLEKTTLSEFDRAADVPNYSVLLNTKLPPMRDWEDMVEDYLSK